MASQACLHSWGLSCYGHPVSCNLWQNADVPVPFTDNACSYSMVQLSSPSCPICTDKGKSISAGKPRKARLLHTIDADRTVKIGCNRQIDSIISRLFAIHSKCCFGREITAAKWLFRVCYILKILRFDKFLLCDHSADMLQYTGPHGTISLLLTLRYSKGGNR